MKPLDRILERSELLARVGQLIPHRRVVGPVERIEPECDPPVRFFYESVEDPADLALEFSYCVYGPKSHFFPPRETLFQFDRSDGTFTARPMYDNRPTALIGVHPCDLHAIATLDGVFSQDHNDEHYFARRRNTLIVGIDCLQPCSDGVFCRDMNAHQAEQGFDVMLVPVRRPTDGDLCSRWGVLFGTQAGRAWLEDVGHPPDEEALQVHRGLVEQKETAFPRMLAAEAEQLPGLLRRAHDAPLWEQVAQHCYSCGSCNLVCPTCYCFDVQDDNELGGNGGCRERQWDGCMLGDFAAVAGGHNFRPTAGQRLRHRLNRKVAWIEQRCGVAGCVGCARCDRACTAKISMVEMLNQLAEAEAGKEAGDE